MAEYLSQQKTKFRLRKSGESVLLRAMIQGEAFYYQAPLSDLIGSNAFQVRFHKTSTILEYLRLFGKITVLARFKKATYEGELTLSPRAEIFLTIFDEIHHEKDRDPCILPIT